MRAESYKSGLSYCMTWDTCYEDRYEKLNDWAHVLLGKIRRIGHSDQGGGIKCITDITAMFVVFIMSHFLVFTYECFYNWKLQQWKQC